LSAQLFKRLNCDVTILNEMVDGNFPGHLPDPSRPENMTDLAHKVVELKADIGFAFDGDGSRLGVVSSDGQIIWPDRILMLLSKDILARNNAASVLYDVKSSKKINGFIQELGGKAIMCRCGHSFMANKLQETGAIIAGEMSGHIFVKDRWFGFDDAAYAAARVLEILSLNQQKSAPIFTQLPQSINTPEILIQTKEVSKIINMLCHDTENFAGGEIIIIDGIRVEYEDGWGIVRASHTTNKLSIRFEADNEVALQRIANTFKAAISNASAEIVLPF
ncbi:MAG: phosphomannomutase/phosphoglucomutase, partial [Thiotrichaceae bacterium]|nr:phosphomannomutase/phosphoglucomutase [Thiotrichaceae bacterium]